MEDYRVGDKVKVIACKKDIQKIGIRSDIKGAIGIIKTVGDGYYVVYFESFRDWWGFPKDKNYLRLVCKST